MILGLMQVTSVAVALWMGLAAYAVGSVFWLRSRWGRKRPAHRYGILSIGAHLALIGLALTIRIPGGAPGGGPDGPVRLTFHVTDAVVLPPSEPLDSKPKPVEPQPIEPQPLEHQADQPKPPEPEAPSAPALEAPELAQQPAEPTPKQPAPVEEPAVDQVATPDESNEPPAIAPPQPDMFPPALIQANDPPAPTLPPLESPAQTPAWTHTPQAAVTAEVQPYAARTPQGRLERAIAGGGSQATEDAVAAGLDWLARAQSEDGRWDADRWGAGRDEAVHGQFRNGAGADADAGVTGLALLALLGAGETPTSGAYPQSVRGGVDYLLSIQRSDGALFGQAGEFSQTYCHSIATFALAEALAVSDDSRLRKAVQRAVQHLLTRQNRSTGGWRYSPGDVGDTSQLGWAAMALRSSELAEVPAPDTAWTGIERFLRSVARGPQGGLAAYRPEMPGPTRSMTAEALYCRQVAGLTATSNLGAGPRELEAITALLGELPGDVSPPNYYYWYYATLALHHQRNTDSAAQAAWETWNARLQDQLLTQQEAGGPYSGSWPPTTLWGGYGGRVYSTAMATMCLEVYYRFGTHESADSPWIATRPAAGVVR